MITAYPHRIQADGSPPEQRIIHPAWALCESKLEKLRDRAKLSDAERKILIKTAILLKLRKSFDLQEIRWTAEERDLLYQVTASPFDCPQHRCAYFTSLTFAENETRVGTHAAIMELALRWKIKFFSPLRLHGLAETEDNFSFATTETWNLKLARQIGAGDEADLFFGILHLVYRKREGEFAENVVADSGNAADERFAKLFHPAEKFVRMLRERQDAKLKALGNFVEELFLRQLPGKIYWLRFDRETVDLHSAPRELVRSWQEFAKKFTAVTIVDEELPAAAAKYFLNRLGVTPHPTLSPQAGRGIKGEGVPLQVLTMPVSSDEVLDFLSGLPGSSIVILPNERVLKNFFETLSVRGHAVIAHKISGNSPERIKAKMGRRTILLLTQHALRYWQTLPEAEHLVIERLPFEAPGARRVPLPADFQSEVLPRAIYALHSMLRRFLAAGGRRHIYLLDHRAVSEYDGEIMDYLQDLPEVDISTIDKW